MANEFKVRKGLSVNGSGSVILDVQGSQGQLFSVTDQLSGSIFAVKDISGMPVIEAFSDDRVNIGTFNREAIKVSGSVASVTGSFTGSLSGSFSGSLFGPHTGSLFGTSSWSQNALTASYALGGSANAILYQTASAATTWSFNHFLQTQYPVFTIYDSNSNVIIPQRVYAQDTSSAFIYFSTPTTGIAVASKGGYSASVVTSATTANTAITASYALFALSASNAPGFTFTFSQSLAAVTWSINHNMNTKTPLVQVYDINYNQLIPNQVASVTQNLTEVRFDYGQSGYAVLSSGMAPFVTGSTSLLNQTTPAVTWSFAHNLNTKYVNFEVYDANDYTMIPSNIKAIDTNNAEIHLAYPTTGKVVANFSGINGQMNAQTASLALTASYVLPLSQSVKVSGSFEITGSIIGTSDLTISATNSTTAAPRIVGVSPLPASSAAEFRFGDLYTAFRSGNAQRMQVVAYYGMEIYGNRTNTATSYAAGTGADPSLNVYGSVAANPVLVVTAAGSQTGNLQEWRNSSNAILASISSNGSLRVSGSLTVTGSALITGSLSVSGSMLVTGSLAMSGSFTQVGYKILTTVSQSLNYADDTAAAAGGVPLGGLYRNGNFILIRLS